MSSRLAPLRLPDLWEACPQWEASGVREWRTPLPEALERSRSIGERVPVLREGGVTRYGVVLGSTSPAVPSEGDLIRAGASLCERGVRVRLDDGSVRVVQSARLRELRRTARPVDPGLRVPWFEGEELVHSARAALKRGDIAESDFLRGGTLPYPHRVGSSPCSGEDRPARVVADVDAWRSGDAYEQWAEGDVVARSRLMLKGKAAAGLQINALGDVVPAALAVESACVGVWEDWVEKTKRGQRAQIREARAEVRRIYPSTAKRSAAHATSKGRLSYAPIAVARPKKGPRGSIYFRPG